MLERSPLRHRYLLDFVEALPRMIYWYDVLTFVQSTYTYEKGGGDWRWYTIEDELPDISVEVVFRGFEPDALRYELIGLHKDESASILIDHFDVEMNPTAMFGRDVFVMRARHALDGFVENHRLMEMFSG